MIAIHFVDDVSMLEQGINELSKDLGIVIDPSGIKVRVEHKQGTLGVLRDDIKGCVLYYDQRHHFFRALGLLVSSLKKGGPFNYMETVDIEVLGPMIDVSRNAVMTVETIKDLLRKLALMGMNQMALYMEDTFTIEDLPYFGYKRGRYSQVELEICDKYASIFGIEMYPCIQTLAHLKEVLKWDYTLPLQDTKQNLLVGSDATYAFIEQMIVAATKPFQSKKINIGLDEAHQLGLGVYLEKHGYRDRLSLMQEHLKRVIEITDRYNLEPMMWSDMYFRHATDTEAHYIPGKEVDSSLIESKPDQVRLVYWDYYHQDPKFYETCIHMHQSFGEVPIFAGGLWTWNGPSVNYVKTAKTAYPQVAACKAAGVKEMLLTIWGDDGNESNIYGSLLGLQLYAELVYQDNPDRLRLAERFETCVGASYEAFMTMGRFDAGPGTDYDQGEIPIYNPSKYILWQDLLGGLFDSDIEGLGLDQYYDRLYETLSRSEQTSRYTLLHQYHMRLAKVLSQKSKLGLQIHNAYRNGDKATLNRLSLSKLPELLENLILLHQCHRDLWYDTYKPQGFEVLDIRYGGLIQRIKTSIYRLMAYVNGLESSLPELETKILPFDSGERTENVPLLNFNQYLKITTACIMGL